MEPIPFPTYADTAQRLLIWTPDQIVPAAAAFGIGIVTDSVTLSVPIGLLLSWAYSKYSAGKPDGYLVHAAYWYGLLPIKSRAAINPFIRRILPL